jgi:hypothetical protein
MLGELGQHVRPHELGKLSTIEQDISVVDRSCLTIRPQLVLIDAEHTNVAAFSDFMGVLPLIADDALVTFHDANLVGDAIQMIERFLQHARTPYSLTILPSCVAVFGFGTFVRSMEAALRPYAEPAAAYFAAARQQRHRSVADAVISQTQGLPGRSIAELVAATNTENARIAELVAATNTANARIAELVAATNAAKAEIVELVAATNTANTEIATLQMALDQAEAAHARDQALIDALQTSINSLTASTSWRVTAPLRAAADLMRGRGA